MKMTQPRKDIGASSPGSLSCKTSLLLIIRAVLTIALVPSLLQQHILSLVRGSIITVTEPVVGTSSPMAIPFATFRIY
jgi:hypothetical protein